RHLVHPLSHFTIRAPGQFHEAPEGLSDLEERVLNLVQGRAGMSMCVMKLDDCPHSSAPVFAIPGEPETCRVLPPTRLVGVTRNRPRRHPAETITGRRRFIVHRVGNLCSAVGHLY